MTLLALLRAWLTRRAAPPALDPVPVRKPGFVDGSLPPLDIDDSTLVFDGNADDDDTVVIIRR